MHEPFPASTTSGAERQTLLSLPGFRFFAAAALGTFLVAVASASPPMSSRTRGSFRMVLNVWAS